MQIIQRMIAVSATGVLVLALLHGGSAAARLQDRGQIQWQKYRDARFRLSLDYPEGWDVRVDPHSIIVRSPDKASFALIENFTRPPGDTAEDYVDSLPLSESTFFPNAHVDQAYTQPANSGDAKEESGVGALTFSGPRGPGTARVLTRIFPSGGLLFAVAAPASQLPAVSPTLVRIIQSVDYGQGVGEPPPQSEPTSSAQLTTESAAPVSLDSLSATVTYKHWVDPKEGAFSCDVPVGWNVDGVSYRYAPLDVRQSIIVRSPHDEMAFMLGDASLPTFTLPGPMWTRLGYRDEAVRNVVGKPMFFMHFMGAEEFNHWYFDNILGKNIDELVVGATTENQGAEKDLTDAFNKPGALARSVFSVAGTAFTGRSKLNGRKIAGILFSINSEYLGNAQGDGNWTARPQVVVYVTDDNKADARKSFVAVVKRHVNGSFKFSREWIVSQNKRAKQFLAANRAATRAVVSAGQANMASMARSHQAYMSQQDDRRTSMIGSFRAQMASKDNMTRKMQNYSLDQTDVKDGSGQSWKVPSGYTNYYHNGRAGVVVGTNSPTNPGGEFSALTQ